MLLPVDVTEVEEAVWCHGKARAPIALFIPRFEPEEPCSQVPQLLQVLLKSRSEFDENGFHLSVGRFNRPCTESSDAISEIWLQDQVPRSGNGEVSAE